MLDVDFGEFLGPQGPSKEIVEKQKKILTKAKQLALAIQTSKEIMNWLKENRLELVDERISAPWGEFYLTEVVEQAEEISSPVRQVLEEYINYLLYGDGDE